MITKNLRKSNKGAIVVRQEELSIVMIQFMTMLRRKFVMYFVHSQVCAVT